MPQHSTFLISSSGKLKLIPPCSNDDKSVSILRSHPVSRQYLRMFPVHISAQEVAARRKTRAENTEIIDFHIHIINQDETSTFAGMTGVFNIDKMHKSCEAGILVAPDMYGKGIATESLYTLLQYIFEDRKMRRMTLETGADNIPMQLWLEEVAGARLEAEKKECWMEIEEGEFTDVKGYAILDWEWRGRIRSRLEERLKLRIS